MKTGGNLEGFSNGLFWQKIFCNIRNTQYLHDQLELDDKLDISVHLHIGNYSQIMFLWACDNFLIPNSANTHSKIHQYYCLKGMDRDHPFNGEALERIDLEPEPRLEGGVMLKMFGKSQNSIRIVPPSQDPDPLPAGPRGTM